MHQTNEQREPRVPVALQAVFLASNRGDEVIKPPPQRVASRTFFLFRDKSFDESAPTTPSCSPRRKKIQQFFTIGSPKKDMKKEAEGAFGSSLKKEEQPVSSFSPPPTDSPRRAKTSGSPKKNVSPFLNLLRSHFV
jgi:hypothetical protein